jgi:hypothetical protein
MWTGAWPSEVSTTAPIDLKGAATRSIGRNDRLGSPVSTDRNGPPASTPHSSRIEVPELPQSRVPIGSSRASRPSPSTSSGRETGTSTPAFHVEPPPSTGERASRTKTSSAGRPFAETFDRHAAVDRTSRDGGSARRRLEPFAVTERMSHRWAIDLSPGSAATPVRRPPGWITTSIGVTRAWSGRIPPSTARRRSIGRCRPRRSDAPFRGRLRASARSGGPRC